MMASNNTERVKEKVMYLGERKRITINVFRSKVYLHFFINTLEKNLL